MRDKITETYEFAEVVKDHLDEFSTRLIQLNRFINADFLFIASVNHKQSKAESLVTVGRKGVLDNFSYSLQGTPCEQVSSESACAINQNVAYEFPDDLLLQHMQIEGYMGITISSNDRRPIAILVALFKEQVDTALLQYPFEVFSSHMNSLTQSYFVSSRLNSQLALLQELSHITKAGAWEYNLNTNTLYWSEEVYDIHALPIDTKVTPGLSINCYSETDREHISELFNEAVVTGKSYQTECEFTDNNGVKKWVRTSGRVRKNRFGAITSVYGVFEDISEERALLNSEKYEREYLEGVLNSMTDAVVTITKSGRILDANNSASRIFGYEQGEMRGLAVTRLMPEPYASKHSGYIREYLKTGKAKIMGVGRQLPALRKNKELFQMELSLSESTFNGKKIFIGLVRDLSERIKAQETIYKAAFTDRITGLKNRSWFEREFRDAISLSEYQESWIYCALVDIDRLSYYNMRYGFSAGDRLVRHVAEKLKAALPYNLKIFKNSVDSFFILYVQRMEEGKGFFSHRESFEQKLMEPVQYQISFDGKSELPTVSIGSLISKASQIHYEKLVDILEFATESAKKKAPSGQYFMGHNQQLEYEHTFRIHQLLENVTQSGELELVLQPQYSDESHFSSSEALLRWHSKELGFVSPGVFIPLAEESDAIIDIGYWVFEEVCKLLAQLRKSEIKTRVAVNVSGKHIVHKDFKSRLLELVQKWQIPPECLVLELTETTLVSDIQFVKDIMLSLNDAGFSFSIDDFGTGYSSLGYLKEMPISELKIDKCFIDEIETEESAATIVDVIINMSKALQVKCVAEGVEHFAQYKYLKSRGCDLSQGYLFSKPLKIAEWREKLLEQNKIPVS